MDWRKGKQWLLYGLVVGSTGIQVGGTFPLLPALYGSLFLCEGNRTVLTLISFFGIALFLPFQGVVKYGIVLLLSATFMKLTEWVHKRCSTKNAGILVGGLTLLLSVAGEVLQVKGRGGFWMGFWESLFVTAFMILAVPWIHRFQEEGHHRKEKEEPVLAPPKPKERLEGYADSFSGSSRMFSGMDQKKETFAQEEMGKIRKEITGKVCLDCGQSAVCWEQTGSSMYRILYQILHGMERQGRPKEEMELVLKNQCPKAEQIMEEASAVLERARLNLSWYNRLLENRQVIAAQLDAMADVIEDCAREYTDVTKEEGKAIAMIKYRLRERGILCQGVRLYRRGNGHMVLHMQVASKWGNCISVRDLAKAASLGLHMEMIPGKDTRSLIGKEGGCYVLEEAPSFQVLLGMAKMNKDGMPVSGDNFSFPELEGGLRGMALSDGMGSGIRACKESEMVLELIEKFLEAGFQTETAIHMMNAAMVLNGEDGLYSTLDLAMLDPYSGMCRCYKIGAAAAFLKRGNQVEVIPSDTLPAGSTPSLEIHPKELQLLDGDFLLLVSDGVMEGMGEAEPEETICKILAELHTNHAGHLAKRLLEQVLSLTGGKVKDDMTVLAAGIWEK